MVFMGVSHTLCKVAMVKQWRTLSPIGHGRGVSYGPASKRRWWSCVAILVLNGDVLRGDGFCTAVPVDSLCFFLR